MGIRGSKGQQFTVMVSVVSYGNSSNGTTLHMVIVGMVIVMVIVERVIGLKGSS